MKKFTLIIVVALVALLLTSCGDAGNHYNEDYANLDASIRWEYVNLRESPSTNSDIIEKLYYGEEVTLTGNCYEYLGGEGLPTESWKEVSTSSGETGWIVTVSINWN